MNPIRAMIGGFLLVIVIVAGTTAIGALGEATGIDGGERVTNEAALFDGNGEYVQLGSTTGKNETVFKTTGYAVNLTGASDSYVQSSSDVDIAADKNWTVSVLAHVDAGNANSQMTTMSVDGRLEITYDGGANQWSAWYYDDGARESYVANVSTSGNEVGNLTNIQVLHNGTHLRIYRDNTLGETVATDGTGTIGSAPVASTNWDGRLEELRTFNTALSASERQTLVDSPAEQLPAANPTARAMFDQPSRDTQLLLYAGSGLTTSNVTYSDGVAAIEVQSASNLLGADYRWDENGPQIASIAGSQLGDAPVAYVSYDKSAGGAESVIDGWVSFANLMAVVPLLLGIVALLGLLSRVQQ